MTRRAAILAGVAILWLLALIFVAKHSLDQLSVPPWGNPVGDSLSAEIAGDTLVGQQFVAPLPGLYAIEVSLQPTGIGSEDQTTFHLKTDPDAETAIWTSSFSGSDVQPSIPRRFEFERQAGSRGQAFYFEFESAASEPGNALAVRYGPDSALENASAYLNGQPMSGNLQFHTFYSLRTREKADLLLTRMAEGRPHFWGTKTFYIILAAVYALVLGAFLVYVARILLAEQSEKS